MRKPPPEQARKVFNVGFVYFLVPGQEPDPELLREHARYRDRAVAHWRHITGGRGQLTTKVPEIRTPGAQPGLVEGTGSLGECQVGLTVGIGQSCTYPGTTDEFSVNERGHGSFQGRLAEIRIQINNETINGRVYDFEASHQGDGVWRIDRIAGSTEVPATGGGVGSTDDDNDGVPNADDAFPQDPGESTDTDGDGTGDNADTDDDNDGTPDVNDPCPFDPDDSCPLLDISGTLFVDPDILTPSDPTTFNALSDAGTGLRLMYDRREERFVTYDAYLFDAFYTDGFYLEIQVNPEFQTTAAARQQAQKYARLIGQLPRALRNFEFQTVWIHEGVELFGGRNNNVLIHTGQAELYEADGLLEEALIHEATHTALDSRHASSAGWIRAQQDDMDFISTYARDFPAREDLAESFPMWMALRYRADRISPILAATIRARMPHRLAYLDAQNFDMAPVK